jgi:hypothetical protein
MSLRTVVERRLTAKQAREMRGKPVVSPDDAVLVPEPAPGEISWVESNDGELLGFVTKLPSDLRAELRRAVLGTEMTGVARTGAGMGRNVNASRIFGWMPRRPMAQRESCRASTMTQEFPEAHAAIEKAALHLTEELRRLAPARYEQDQALLSESILPEWRIAENALFTSGVINKSFQLPYHFDAMNFHTWSAMPTLRKGIVGGQLHLPEWGVLFPCSDGDVTWFCGRELLHGVTPMETRKGSGRSRLIGEAYRYSIVYYALQGLKDCATHAVESGEAAKRRSARESAMARLPRPAGEQEDQT